MALTINFRARFFKEAPSLVKKDEVRNLGSFLAESNQNKRAPFPSWNLQDTKSPLFWS